ncbi:D-glycero-beta-D-manno-heptose 1-phosphate adenylyltransferase [Pontibacter sp. BT310]|uniref:D-glycero-beta-D-manno-heptose 1-phosphate adenylyltransferase n=1 Tax=Pontibacter populi TaxID=890055 RepID=A0ABS6X8U4_9BACT|nr:MULTISPECIES: D-glycero-beta-D-manno-heptose 1-phosphate adenylyltransferase [Pontibacter]MBJ6117561.1 D-glycero-beta-D-manno-heptose 1-phosphate adenylyltransferase [Pontibacter sp. BT310]MBR0569986.1 D-glycero-beta-D-manno-heptose 1-phosphate adenylyltransferase [Microvirga sp. STS03]MBW3364414.1 D-glycero-beta-D-manno-heptose 1-phosphate adenylyltransferase [Pontibacter populi]
MNSTDKIFTLPALLEQLQLWRSQGQKIVFTNGCFDLLHLGHVDYLEKARQLGDKLVLGLNTDRSISSIKGPNRPLQDEMSRARVMASLLFVDAVVLFDSDTPLELIKTVQPDILVKGDDYSIEQIVGHDVVQQAGGVVKTVPLVTGYSTTSIVKKIKNQLNENR